eukprot:gene38143-46346_t
MEDVKLQQLHDALAKLAPKGHSGGLGLGSRALLGKVAHRDPSLPQNPLYMNFVRAGSCIGQYHKRNFEEDSAESGENSDNKKDEKSEKKKTKKEKKENKEKKEKKVKKDKKEEKTKPIDAITEEVTLSKKKSKNSKEFLVVDQTEKLEANEVSAIHTSERSTLQVVDESNTKKKKKGEKKGKVTEEAKADHIADHTRNVNFANVDKEEDAQHQDEEAGRKKKDKKRKRELTEAAVETDVAAVEELEVPKDKKKKKKSKE